MTDINLDDVDAAVAQATSEESFDVLSFFSNAALPKKTVTLYADAEAAFELAEIAQTRKEIEERDSEEGIGITDEVEYIDEDHVEELQTRLKASAVSFRVVGLAPAARDAIEKAARAKHKYVEGTENSEYNEAFNSTLIAKSINEVANARGARDTSDWTSERVIALSRSLQPSEFGKLSLAVFEVNYIGDAIDRAVSADFS